VVYATHPFDVVGWDGYNFPMVSAYHNFEPITGRYINRHQYIKHSKHRHLWFVPLSQDCTITIQNQFQLLYNHSNIDSDDCIMLMVIL
jgi:homogentisate 1,2-dioxygenase